MKKPSITVIDRARPFRAEELFYSTTDRKGIIETGNDVFYRVAEYTEDQLVGQPHNIIRHPDMPRGAFKLVWEHLLSARPVAAYVKNLASDGAYYWVLALIAPIDGGFISVRQKPCSPLFPLVEGLYAAMKQREEAVLEEGQPPAAAMAASLQLLQAELKKKGFADYDDFMSRALIPTELSARKKLLGGALPPDRIGLKSGDPVLEALGTARSELVRSLKQLAAATSKLEPVLARHDRTMQTSTSLTRQTEGIGLMAMNVSLKAVQLGEIGAGTGVIAGFLGEGAVSMRQRVSQLGERLAKLNEKLSAVAAACAWGELEYEMVLHAVDEVITLQASGKADPETLARRVLGLQRLRLGVVASRGRMLASLGPFLDALVGIEGIADTATELSISLGAAHVGGRVESARLPQHHSMEEILGDLRAQLDGARARLEEIKGSVAALAELRQVMTSTEQVVHAGASALERNIRSLQRAYEGAKAA